MVLKLYFLGQFGLVSLEKLKTTAAKCNRLQLLNFFWYRAYVCVLRNTIAKMFCFYYKFDYFLPDRGKIIEDACEKRENLLKTFQVIISIYFKIIFNLHCLYRTQNFQKICIFLHNFLLLGASAQQVQLLRCWFYCL